ncbi:MAG: M55 family metallopeptidase [Fervidicoccaceae archaeon]
MVKRAFISVDLEGLPHIVHRAQLSHDRPLWSEGRKIATAFVSEASKTLLENGFDEVVVADSHGEMLNVDPFELPNGTILVRGYPRLKSMISGAEGSSVAFFIGYHAGFGTKNATFDHTYSGSAIHKVEINKVLCSEFLINALALSEMGIPVGLVAGDSALEPEVRKFTPWSIFVPLKRSIGRYASLSPSMVTLIEEIRKASKEAAEAAKRGELRIIALEKPVTLDVTFQNTSYADVAEYLPWAKRIDGLTVEFVVENALSALSLIELLAIASAGVRSMSSP